MSLKRLSNGTATDPLADPQSSSKHKTMELKSVKEVPGLNDILHDQLDLELNTINRDKKYKMEEESDVSVILLVRIVKGCEQLNQHYAELENALQLLQSNADLRSMLFKAFQKGKFSNIRKLVILQSASFSDSSRDMYRRTEMTKKAVGIAWNLKFEGNVHEVLLNNIQRMNRKQPYSNFVSIIQSSGTGKSRMVDEMSSLVFTIPFNLRRAEDSREFAFPDPDSAVHDCLLTNGQTMTINAVTALYFNFLCCTFEIVRQELKTLFSTQKQVSRQLLASTWRTHLRTHRRRLYQSIVDCTKQCSTANREDSRIKTSDELKELVKQIEALVDTPKADGSDEVTVMLYFDEAQVLSKAPSQNSDNNDRYDVLCSCLCYFTNMGLFAIFLSTNAYLTPLPPPGPMAPSGRVRDNSDSIQTPITEVSFDLTPMVKQETLTLKDVSKIEFMAQFGRPLYWALIQGAAAIGLKDALIWSMISKVRSRLLCHNDVLRNNMINNEARIAVIDIRLMLDYEPRSRAAIALQAGLVTSHMRMVYSIPQNREYIRSGYPSEPILAEAAAQQMYILRQTEPSAVLDCLIGNLRSGLLAMGERGELVGRYLLISAYDRAVERPNAGSEILVGTPPMYSKGCSVIAFIEELFTPENAERILNSEPDNLKGMKFKEAFKDARMRFTHFGKVADDIGVSTDAMLAALIRGMAIITRSSEHSIGAMIPILLWDEKLQESVVTALMVQFERRIQAGSKEQYRNRSEDFPFFPVHSMPVNPNNPNPKADTRPYITLVMELGVRGKVAGAAHTPAETRTKRTMKSAANVKYAHGRGGRFTTPDREEASIPEIRNNLFVGHPRYSIFAYGCSDAVYKVIGATEKSRFAFLLASRDMLSEHPRQEPDSLRVVRRMKPFFSKGQDSWHWIDSVLLNGKELEVPDEYEVVTTGSPVAIDDDDGDGDSSDDD